MNTVVMPNSSATRQACCPPAPPKQASAKPVASWPFCTDTCLIALAMLATAMRRNPSARSRGSRAWPVAAATSAARAANFSATTAPSSRSSPPGPKIAGKCAGWILPTCTLASVTVSGPPRR